MSLLTKLFGDYSSKEVKRVMPIQKKVLSYEDEYSRLSDEELKAKTPELKGGNIRPQSLIPFFEWAFRVLLLSTNNLRKFWLTVTFIVFPFVKRMEFAVYRLHYTIHI